MIIFVMNEKIFGYIPSAELTEERKQEILTENPYAVWVDEEINYPDATKQYEMYYIDGAIGYQEIVEETAEPTDEEILQAEILLNQAEILARQNEQDEVLAAILLNQVEVL